MSGPRWAWFRVKFADAIEPKSRELLADCPNVANGGGRAEFDDHTFKTAA